MDARKKPSPTPATHLPTNSVDKFGLPADRADPAAKMSAPVMIVYFREIRSDIGPAASPEKAEGRRMELFMSEGRKKARQGKRKKQRFRLPQRRHGSSYEHMLTTPQDLGQWGLGRQRHP